MINSKAPKFRSMKHDPHNIQHATWGDVNSHTLSQNQVLMRFTTLMRCNTGGFSAF